AGHGISSCFRVYRQRLVVAESGRSPSTTTRKATCLARGTMSTQGGGEWLGSSCSTIDKARERNPARRATDRIPRTLDQVPCTRSLKRRRTARAGLQRVDLGG